MTGLPHLSGVQSFNNDLFRTGSAEAAAAEGHGAEKRAAPDAVQELEQPSATQPGESDHDGEVRRDRARDDAEGAAQRRGQPDPRTGDLVALESEQTEKGAPSYGRLFGRLGLSASGIRADHVEQPRPRATLPRFLTREEEVPRQLEDVLG